MIRITFALLAISFGLNAFAGWQEGQITDILIRESDGLHYFNMQGQPSDRPDCATAYKYWMIKDETSDVGKAQLSLLLTAYAAGLNVVVKGSDQCTRWKDGEDVNYIQLKK
ncbi:hypothetical protein [Alteromonas sp. ASW11-130]|uniref:hypothetical protein n=1 Tax=Alteromonas sp. ASW11-130 TaxID=3015775 RepID=UPI002242187F|nr:hypothetical protein [Alteromonas sp. ASW11-130]MCW8090203.1 hypothetical protein [Alteromonas sp. ASW11-130]